METRWSYYRVISLTALYWYVGPTKNKSRIKGHAPSSWEYPNKPQHLYQHTVTTDSLTGQRRNLHHHQFPPLWCMVTTRTTCSTYFVAMATAILMVGWHRLSMCDSVGYKNKADLLRVWGHLYSTCMCWANKHGS